MVPTERSIPDAGLRRGSAVPPAPAAGGAGPWGEDDARTARSGYALRRLRYFRDLLTAGYRVALGIDPLSGSTLRRERIALGIDFAELDAVALWSVRTDEGTIAIPFIAFLLGQIVASVEALSTETPSPGSAAEWGRAVVTLDTALRQAGGGGTGVPSLPDLRDRFLPEAFLVDLCGPGGLLDRTLARCEELVFRTGS